VNTGQYITFDENTPYEDIPTVILASASMPMIFPYVHYKGHNLMDGGAVWNTNIISAVDKCRELVDSDSQVILDVVLLYSPKISMNTEDLSSFWYYFRHREIKTYNYILSDIETFKVTRPNI
jgi:predicted acylesterase/phospholipase RssA